MPAAAPNVSAAGYSAPSGQFGSNQGQMMGMMQAPSVNLLGSGVNFPVQPQATTNFNLNPAATALLAAQSVASRPVAPTPTPAITQPFQSSMVQNQMNGGMSNHNPHISMLLSQFGQAGNTPASAQQAAALLALAQNQAGRPTSTPSVAAMPNNQAAQAAALLSLTNNGTNARPTSAPAANHQADHVAALLSLAQSADLNASQASILAAQLQKSAFGPSLTSSTNPLNFNMNMNLPTASSAADQLLGGLIQNVQNQQQDWQSLRIQQLLEQHLSKQGAQSLLGGVQAAGQAAGLKSPGSSGSPEKSLLKKKKKAHLLKKRSGDNKPSPHAKKLKSNSPDSSLSSPQGSEEASAQDQAAPEPARQEEAEEAPEPAPEEAEEAPVEPQQKAEQGRNNTEPSFGSQLLCFLKSDRDHVSFGSGPKKNHFGLQSLIREWIAQALSRRSFDLLSRAADLADEFEIDMDMIFCGLTLGSDSSNQKTGGRMHWLLPMLLEPRSSQAKPVDERKMLIPNLPTSFLPLITPHPCTSFKDLDVKNRWIMMQENHRGNTQFYCSPSFEKNVMSWAHMSKLYEDNLADIFSLIFAEGELNKMVKVLAHQVSLRHDQNTTPSSSHVPMTKIRLLSRSESEAVETSDLDMMLISYQVADKHLYYIEFFSHRATQIDSLDDSVPPRCEDIMGH